VALYDIARIERYGYRVNHDIIGRWSRVALRARERKMVPAWREIGDRVEGQGRFVRHHRVGAQQCRKLGKAVVFLARILGKAVDAAPKAFEPPAADKMVDEWLAIPGPPGVIEGKNALAVSCSLKKGCSIGALRPSCHEYNIYYLL
jgi:hypothetical protein